MWGEICVPLEITMCGIQRTRVESWFCPHYFSFLSLVEPFIKFFIFEGEIAKCGFLPVWKVISPNPYVVQGSTAGVQPQQDPGEPSGWTASANERDSETKLRAKSEVYFFARLLYTLNNIFGGSAYCLHTGHLKTLQQLDLQQKLDVTHILFCSQESFLSFGLQAC